MLKRIVAALFITAMPLASLADEPEAVNCAKDLSADSKLIYDESSAALTPEKKIGEVVEAKTRALVHEGKISMWDARSAAESAYSCLQKSMAEATAHG